MTRSGEISSTKSSIINVLNDVKSTFDGITGANKWQGDSMEGLKSKVETFVGDAISILESKLDVLAQFAQKYEDFEGISTATVSVRAERHRHCQTGHSCGNGCCCPPSYDEDGNMYCAWSPKGCFTGPRDIVKNNVQKMDALHNAAAGIKGGFPSATVPKGEGIEPFFDY